MQFYEIIVNVPANKIDDKADHALIGSLTEIGYTRRETHYYREATIEEIEIELDKRMEVLNALRQNEVKIGRAHV